MAGGDARDAGEAGEVDPTGSGEGVLDESAVGIWADLADEVGGVVGRELGGAAGLVRSLAAGERLPGAGGHRLPFLGKAVDLHVDVGVRGPHNNERR